MKDNSDDIIHKRVKVILQMFVIALIAATAVMLGIAYLIILIFGK